MPPIQAPVKPIVKKKVASLTVSGFDNQTPTRRDSASTASSTLKSKNGTSSTNSTHATPVRDGFFTIRQNNPYDLVTPVVIRTIKS